MGLNYEWKTNNPSQSSINLFSLRLRVQTHPGGHPLGTAVLELNGWPRCCSYGVITHRQLIQTPQWSMQMHSLRGLQMLTDSWNQFISCFNGQNLTSGIYTKIWCVWKHTSAAVNLLRHINPRADCAKKLCTIQRISYSRIQWAPEGLPYLKCAKCILGFENKL